MGGGRGGRNSGSDLNLNATCLDTRLFKTVFKLYHLYIDMNYSFY